MSDAHARPGCQDPRDHYECFVLAIARTTRTTNHHHHHFFLKMSYASSQMDEVDDYIPPPRPERKSFTVRPDHFSESDMDGVETEFTYDRDQKPLSPRLLQSTHTKGGFFQAHKPRDSFLA